MKVKCNLVPLLISIFVIKYVICAKILFFAAIPALSHQKIYQEVWKEMSLRGHQVYSVTPNPKFNKLYSNLTEYDISSMYDFQDTQIKVEYKKRFFEKPTFLGMIIRQIIYQYFGGLGYETLFSHQEVKRLVKEHDRFDVCILEWFHPSAAVFGHIFKCPTIGISSNGLPVQMLDTIGNPSHPITAPEQDLPILRNEFTFLQTAWSLFWAVFVRIHHHCFLLPSEDKRIKRFYGKDVPYLGDLERNVSLLILSRNVVFHRPVPNVPNLIELGSIKYPRPVIKIDPALKEFLDTSEQGVIYFSLGISMSGVLMPPKYVKKIQNVFKTLPLNIVWKWENETMPNKPSNVFISKFIPQLYALGFSHVQSANILFISSTPSPSHQKPFQKVWKALALKGHEIHVVTPNPLLNHTIPNLIQYNISDVYTWVADINVKRAKTVKYTLEKPNFFNVLSKELLVPRGWHILYEYTFNHEEVKRLINTKPKLKFDAVIVEWLYPTLAGFGAYFEAPLIGICSLGAPTNGLDAIGNILNPVVTPDQNIPLKRDEFSFRDRLLSSLYAAWIRILYRWYVLPWEDQVVKHHLGTNLPYLGDIERNVSLLLLNRNQISHRIMSVVPGIVEYGGFKYEKDVQTLNSELKDYLDNAKNGVVYFSLGAAIKQVVFLSRQQIQIFKNVLGQIPYKILWKWENGTMEGKPENVFISQWINQTAVLVFLALVCCFVIAQGAKILFLSCTPAPSHQKPFQAIWRALSLRGHKVHALTPNPLRDPTLTNLTEYDISEYYELLRKFDRSSYNYVTAKPSFITAFVKDGFVTKILSNIYNRTLNHKETRRILNNNNEFDVVIVEWLFPTLAAFASYYNAPFIGITSLGAPMVSLDTLGNPSHPIAAPDMNLPLSRDLSFRERFMSSLYAVYVRIYYHLVVLPREDYNIKNHLRSDLPYIGDIEKNISVLLMNRNPVFHRVMPLIPNTIDLGGIKFPKSNDTLDPELKTFIESSKLGTVYFSLGSSVRSVGLPENIVTLLQGAFKSLRYNIIWKWENETLEGKPDNVYIIKWVASQTAVLEHPNVKLFITQGGLQSTEEAIAAHKPIIGIPFHSDQTTNVDTCVKYGMGKMLDLEELTEEKLRNYILEIVGNPSYAENAKKLDELMKDQPQDGLEKAIWWIEYVIRHKGAKHLRSIAVDLPWWKYLMLDVIGFILLVLLSVIFIAYQVLKLFIRLLLGRGKNSESKSKRKTE